MWLMKLTVDRTDEPIRALTGWKDESLEASYLSSMSISVQDNEVWLAVEPSGPAGEKQEQVLGVMTVKPPGRGKGPRSVMKSPSGRSVADMEIPVQPELEGTAVRRVSGTPVRRAQAVQQGRGQSLLPRRLLHQHRPKRWS